MVIGNSLLTVDMIVTRREYFIKKVKSPLMKGLIACTSGCSKLLIPLHVIGIVIAITRFTEPSRENCRKQMSKVLMDIWDEFEKWENNPGRAPLFKAARKISLCITESDNYYSQRLTWFILKLVLKYLLGEWPAHESWTPEMCWTNPHTLAELEKAKKEFQTTLTINGRHISTIET